MLNYIKRYFNWLQKDNPVGEVEKYPEIDEKGETSVKGVYIIGDLTGIPLLKLAAEKGKEIIDQFNSDPKFSKIREEIGNDDIFDIIIIGAGPAGISAGIEAQKYGFKCKILEASKKFTTIINFPKGKPIYAEPSNYQQSSSLIIQDGTKETLLEDLNNQIAGKNLPILEGMEVEQLIKRGKLIEVVTGSETIKCLRVILAIGKSGNSRKLNVPGEERSKVYNRLFDPQDALDEDVLVVGGGDSALETAIATAEYANSVSLSYRKKEFSRPKEGNEEKLKNLADAGKIKLYLETEVKTIDDDQVILNTKEGKEIKLENSIVFTMIGRELPTDFFKRSGIKIEGELSTTAKLHFVLLILFSAVLYFGKSSAEFFKHFLGVDKAFDSWGSILQKIFTIEFWSDFFTLPAAILTALFSDQTRIWQVTKYINAFVAYIAFIPFVILGIYLLAKFIRDNFSKFTFDWKTFKYTYFIFVGIFFTVIFFGSRYFGLNLFDKSQGFWYTGFYSLTIFIFGLRRMKIKPTRYIKYQTWALILIQAFPLFILPEFVFPLLGKAGLLGSNNGFFLTQVFPNESYWRSYGFILAWPLNFSNLYNGNITAFWLLFSIFQTFIVIPYIVYRWGKGAYCGWICSCGALAETLGDEYRTTAPHGPKAKRWENTGQVILAAAFIITGLKLISILYNIDLPLINESISYSADFMQKFYYIGIDVIFAGVLGVGVYFFLSGRFWCRFGCPLAALMHIYARFTRYRIFSEKKKCISCNICTKVCHMGIDVMNYANKGIPMNDVECVRCSACVVNCPTEVLTFGSQPSSDLDNTYFKKNKVYGQPKSDWRSGL